jgi:hypothetical protein
MKIEKLMEKPVILIKIMAIKDKIKIKELLVKLFS